MIIKGNITSFDEENINVTAHFDDYNFLLNKQVTECEIRLYDNRTITVDQRKKIYATMKDISLWSGHVPDEIKALLKYDFIAKTGCEYFSLSNCSVTIARQFLEFLIEFCLENCIACSDSLIERSPDINRYIYACLLHKKCCISGLKNDLHHLESVGSGRNRRKIIHEGMNVLPLSRQYHNECHLIGDESFLNKYHLVPIKLDKKLCNVYGLKTYAE